jgi:uncharacterized membrane protein HdeD (DUF308 family)
MLSRNLYILAGTLSFFAAVAYVMALTGFAHEVGTPSDESLWRTIGIVLLLIALVVALMGVLQHMFEQTDRRTPGGQAGVHQRYVERQAATKAARDKDRGRG